MNRSLIILTMGIAGVGLGIFGLVRYIDQNPQPAEILLVSDEARRDILAEYGCTTKEVPPEQQDIILPTGGDMSVYGDYCALQQEQQLPLSDHFGEEAVMWTYTLEDSPYSRAEIICTPDGLLLGLMRYDNRSFHRMYPIII
jgi:hypothetical protein